MYPMRSKSASTFALSRHHDSDKHNLKKKNLLLYKALHENNKYTRFTYLVWRFPFTLAHQSVTLLYMKFGTPASKHYFLLWGSTKKGKRKEIRKELCEIIAGYFFIRVFLHSTYLQYTIWKFASVSSLTSKDVDVAYLLMTLVFFFFSFLSFQAKGHFTDATFRCCFSQRSVFLRSAATRYLEALQGRTSLFEVCKEVQRLEEFAETHEFFLPNGTTLSLPLLHAQS